MRILSDEEAAASQQGAGRPPKYNWDEWFSHGDAWVEITRGEDYDVPTENMRVQVNSAARRKGGRAVTRIVEKGKGLKFQFISDPDPTDFSNFFTKPGERNPLDEPLGPPAS
jgi:hypothetical protein